MNARLPAAAFALAAALAFAATASGGPDGATIRYRLDGADGRPAGPSELRIAVGVLEKRIDGAGLAGVTIKPEIDKAQVAVSLPAELASKSDDVRKLVERLGTLEFRIKAVRYDEERWEAAKRKDEKATPTDLMRVPRNDGEPDLLVERPEGPIAAEMEILRKHGAKEDDPDMQEARARFDAAVRENVFTGDQLARAGVAPGRTSFLVAFEFKDDRKAAFAAFTAKNVKRRMAIILDGKVESVTILMAKLPGEGRIEGGGETGFTEAEAKALAAVLASGSLPGRLVRVETSEAK